MNALGITRKHRLTALFTVIAILALCTSAFAAKKDDDEIKVRSVEIMNDTATVRVNQTRTLYAIIKPRDADDMSITWESSNWEVAAVDDEGVVTGISPGTAEITATSHNGRTGSCLVTVPDSVIKSDVVISDIKNDEIAASEIRAGEELNAAALRVDVENALQAAAKNETPTLTYKDKTTVSTAALRSAYYAANAENGAVKLKFRTLDESGAIQGQITMNPADAPEDDITIKTGVYTQGSNIDTYTQRAKAQFDAPVAAVELKQQGGYGMSVRVAAKVDLSGFGADAKALKFYRYNSETGSYTELERTQALIDQNGYIHFNTNQGGVVIIVG